MTGSVLFYVQYLLGTGHLQRALRISQALVREGVGVTLVSGGEPTRELAAAAGELRVVALPQVRALDARFVLVDSAGRAIDEALRAARREALLAAFAAARPDAVVLEGFPFARRAFAFELDPLIQAARRLAPRPALIASVRDIVVVRDDSQRHREIVDRVRADFDLVLVHGDPGFIPFAASFPAAAEIADRLVYTGYVAPPSAEFAKSGVPAGEVLVSAGGGGTGYALLSTALQARRRGCLADAPWRLLAGGALPAARFAALAEAAPAGVAVERVRPDFAALLRRCRVSVSQAGYNTVLDVLAARARAVLVPFAAERETEQRMRAERLAEHGVAELVPEAALSPSRLAAAIERAATRDPAILAIDTGGARASARLIAERIGSGPPS